MNKFSCVLSRHKLKRPQRTLGDSNASRPYPVRRGVGAGSPSADTSPQGRGQATRSPPTGHIHPPSRQSGSSVAGAQSSLPWRHTPAVAPSGRQPPASCLAGNRDWEPPTRREATGM